MVEAGYSYNPQDLSLEYYSEVPADYDWQTSGVKEDCLAELEQCAFSYSDGESWQGNWSQEQNNPPKMIRIAFKYKDEDQQREFLVNIPISP